MCGCIQRRGKGPRLLSLELINAICIRLIANLVPHPRLNVPERASSSSMPSKALGLWVVVLLVGRASWTTSSSKSRIFAHSSRRLPRRSMDLPTPCQGPNVSFRRDISDSGGPRGLVYLRIPKVGIRPYFSKSNGLLVSHPVSTFWGKKVHISMLGVE